MGNLADAGLGLLRKSIPRFFNKAYISHDEQIKRLDGLLSSGESSLKRAFLESVGNIRDSIVLDEIVSLIEVGDVPSAILYLDKIVPGFFALVAEVRTDLFIDAGKSAAAEISKNAPQVFTRFNQSNTRAMRMLGENRGRLIRELTESQRDATYRVILEGIRTGRNPRDVARDFRNSIGLTARQELSIRNYRKGLEIGDTSITLHRTLRDRRSDSLVTRFARDNKSLPEDKINHLTNRYRERYLKYRAEVIARTESLRAVNEASHEMWSQVFEDSDGVIDEREVRRKWITAGDHRVRSAHVVIPDLNIEGRGIGEAFITPLGPLMFPGDPAGIAANVIQCRCVIVFDIVPLQ